MVSAAGQVMAHVIALTMSLLQGPQLTDMYDILDSYGVY